MLGFLYILLLVGDQTGHVIQGIWIEFMEEILLVYNSILQKAFEHVLKWVYMLGPLQLPAGINEVLPYTWAQDSADMAK
jgi:hypothetical protein